MRTHALPSLDLLPLLVIELVLVAYLLPLFRAGGELLCGCRDPVAYRLPRAYQTADIEDPAPIVRIDRREIRLDGRPVGRVSLAPGPIEPLRDELTTLAANFTLLHPDDEPTGRYYVEADRDTPAGVIHRVQRSAAAAGFTQPIWIVEDANPER